MVLCRPSSSWLLACGREKVGGVVARRLVLSPRQPCCRGWCPVRRLQTGELLHTGEPASPRRGRVKPSLVSTELPIVGGRGARSRVVPGVGGVLDAHSTNEKRGEGRRLGRRRRRRRRLVCLHHAAPSDKDSPQTEPATPSPPVWGSTRETRGPWWRRQLACRQSEGALKGTTKRRPRTIVRAKACPVTSASPPSPCPHVYDTM
jgi:hypothetical protein